MRHMKSSSETIPNRTRAQEYLVLHLSKIRTKILLRIYLFSCVRKPESKHYFRVFLEDISEPLFDSTDYGILRSFTSPYLHELTGVIPDTRHYTAVDNRGSLLET